VPPYAHLYFSNYEQEKHVERLIWQRYSKVVDRTSGWSSAVAGILIIALTAVVVFMAFVRAFTTFSPDWGFLMTLFLYGTMIMLSGAEVLRRDDHVAVDILPSMLPRKPGDALRIFSTLVIIVVCVFVVFVGSDLAWASTIIDEHSSQGQSGFDPPIWWFRWIIPISFFLILLEALRRLGHELRNFGKVPTDDESSGLVPNIEDGNGANA
jgi:TRAP-type C4-dicarboxylate transport system permease small subunit